MLPVFAIGTLNSIRGSLIALVHKPVLFVATIIVIVSLAVSAGHWEVEVGYSHCKVNFPQLLLLLSHC
jgi:hypothetical protein